MPNPDPFFIIQVGALYIEAHYHAPDWPNATLGPKPLDAEQFHTLEEAQAFSKLVNGTILRLHVHIDPA